MLLLCKILLVVRNMPSFALIFMSFESVLWLLEGRNIIILKLVIIFIRSIFIQTLDYQLFRSTTIKLHLKIEAYMQMNSWIHSQISESCYLSYMKAVIPFNDYCNQIFTLKSLGETRWGNCSYPIFQHGCQSSRGTRFAWLLCYKAS